MAQRVYNPDTGEYEYVDDPANGGYTPPAWKPASGQPGGSTTPDPIPGDPWADYRPGGKHWLDGQGQDRSNDPTFPNPGAVPPGYTPPPAGQSAAHPASHGAGAGTTLESIFNQFKSTKTPTSSSLDELLAAWKAIGIDAKRAPRANGQLSDDKVILPDGRMIDLITDVGGPGAGWSWQDLSQQPNSPAQTGTDWWDQFLGGATSQTGSGAASGNTLSQLMTATSGSSPLATDQGGNADFRAILNELVNSGGRPNTGALKLRLEGARQNLDTTRQSQTDSVLARLASQGIVNDQGGTVPSLTDLETKLGAEYGNQVNQITADEYNRADDRMMTALSLLTGMSTADLDRAVRQYEAETGRVVGLGGLANQRLGIQNDMTLGLGNLALGNARLGADYNLGLGNLQLGGDQLLATLLQLLGQNASTSAGGHE